MISENNSLKDTLYFESIREFWNERGRGARYRLTTIGVSFFQEKIKLGNCGQCHLREKIDQAGNKFVDKTVNFSARNPITCAGCHENVTPVNHPGKPLPMPTEEVCQRCHHGKIHGKFVIFRAECEDFSNTENCVKCHPYLKKEKDVEVVKR